MRLLSDVLDLVLLRSCVGCGAPGGLLCPACTGELARRPAVRTAPEPCPPGLPPTCTAGPYDGVLRAALLAHKERAALGLTRPLGELLAGAVRQLAPGPAVLVPVPSSRAVVRARGHDHALRLAQVAAARTGLDVAPVLETVRRVRDASGLDASARAANLAGALRAPARVAGVPVVVVDDVVTTGATLSEAARALTAAGARVRGAATVAATRRRGCARRVDPAE